MVLIHEAIGKVIYDPIGEYKPGTKVAMVPNTPVEEDDIVAENYMRSSLYRSCFRSKLLGLCKAYGAIITGNVFTGMI